jgi:hypothetical protein
VHAKTATPNLFPALTAIFSHETTLSATVETFAGTVKARFVIFFRPDKDLNALAQLLSPTCGYFRSMG